MPILLVGETSHGHELDEGVAKCVTCLNALGEIHVLVLGADARPAAEAAARLVGVSKVIFAEGAPDHNLPENSARIIASLKGYSHIAAASTAFAKSTLPRAAALLDVMVIPDVVEVIDADTFQRPIYAGNALQTIKSRDPIKVLTIRTVRFAAATSDEDATPAPIEIIGSSADQRSSEWVEDKMTETTRPELTGARFVVSGGRGVGSAANFALIEQLADALGAAVGASRAAVDSGYAANDCQVGQTGKVVAPEIYVAVGISGAIQHLAGMKDSKTIIAINKDEDAPIFQVADYGLVGDLNAIVPVLIEKLGNRRTRSGNPT